MVKFSLPFFVLFLPIAALLPARAAAQPAENLRVMSFNIRFANPDDGYNAWEHRKELAASMIRYHDADAVGLQEALYSQLKDLETLLPGYEWFGVDRNLGSAGPEATGEFSAILYRADRLERLDGGTFWLSPHPDSVGSKGWDAALPRIVTWCRFRDKRSGRNFYHFNTHFDHIGQQARAESARLLLSRIAAMAGETPVVLTGDFNCVPTDPPYLVLTAEGSPLRDGIFATEQPHHGPQATWSGFQFPGVPGRRIDYVFVTPGVGVRRHAILSDSWSGRFPSDHLPVLAEVALIADR